jgi:hypothetical protein
MEKTEHATPPKPWLDSSNGPVDRLDCNRFDRCRTRRYARNFAFDDRKERSSA